MYISILERNEHPPERWTKAYETKWRTVEIDVQLIVPQVENMPILLASHSVQDIKQAFDVVYEFQQGKLAEQISANE